MPPRASSHGHRGVQPDGRSQSLTYTSWRSIIQRCTNPRHEKYHYYGGKGIKVVERWRTFANFLEDMGERPSKRHTLGRSTPFSDYGPRECAWETLEEQNAGLLCQRKQLVTARGITLTKEDWAKKLKISYARYLRLLSEGRDPYERLQAGDLQIRK